MRHQGQITLHSRTGGTASAGVSGKSRAGIDRIEVPPGDATPPHEPPVGSRRREEADFFANQRHPPPHVGGYGSGGQSANFGWENSLPFPRREETRRWRAVYPAFCSASLTCLLLLLCLLFATNSLMAGSSDLVDQGQRAFQNGNFSQAADDWQKAVDAFRKQGNTNAEIVTSVSLASAYQSIGQQLRAVQTLSNTLARAEKTGDRNQVTLVKSKLGAALVLTMETEPAASLLREALEGAKAEHDSKLAGAILNDLGNLLTTQQKYAEALTNYEESVAFARETGNTLLTA